MTLAAYRHLLAKRQVQVVVASSSLAGITVGLPLGLILLVQGETGSFASAGAVTGALAIASAVSSPYRGRLIDRYGQTRTLPRMALVSAAGLVGLVAAALAGAPVAVLIALAALSGLTHAPLLSSTRPLWADLVDHPEQLPAAYALQAILLEVFFIAGPLAAAALIAFGSPAAAVLVMALTELLGVLALAATPASRAWRAPRRTVGRAGAMASPGVRSLVAVDVPFGAMFGALDVAVSAFAKANGATAAAGVVLAALAVGSATGGVVYGARARKPTVARYGLLLGALALCSVPLAFADSIVALGVLMAVAGLFVAPGVSVGFALIDDVTPAGTASEATSWLSSAYQGGLALGTAIAGATIESAGTTAVFLGAAGCAGLATLIVWAGRRSLRPPPDPAPATT